MSGVSDVLGPGLDVVFCGINPGGRSGQLGQHFAHPGNRFWKVLHGAGFTAGLLTPARQWELLELGLGITNLVGRPTSAASDLTRTELRDGAAALEARMAVLRPRWVAVLGVQAYRVAFAQPGAVIGRQPGTIGAGTGLWLLPNPSGLQARYRLDEMIRLFAELKSCLGGAAMGLDPPAPEIGVE